MRIGSIVLMGLLIALCGCQTGGTVDPSAAREKPLAEITGLAISKDQVARPLLDLYGLEVLLYTLQLDIAKQEAKAQGITVSEQDIKDELSKSLLMVFPTLKDARGIPPESAMANLQSKLEIDPASVGIWLQTNAYLRKILDTQIKGAVDEKVLRDAFGMMYGEKVEVRHLQLANMQEVAEAQRRLAAGQPFEKVAQDLSRDPLSAANGGWVALWLVSLIVTLLLIQWLPWPWRSS